MLAEQETQVCNICNKALPLEMFGKGSRANGKDGRCKPCRKTLYEKNREIILEAKKKDWLNGGREKFHKNKSKLNAFLKRLLSVRKDNKIDNLSIETLKELWEKQEGLCALTGKPMTHIAGQGILFDNVSVDRIDSNKGYDEDNIQLVRCGLNYMKHTCSLEKFLDICEEVLEYHGNKTD